MRYKANKEAAAKKNNSKLNRINIMFSNQPDTSGYGIYGIRQKDPYKSLFNPK